MSNCMSNWIKCIVLYVQRFRSHSLLSASLLVRNNGDVSNLSGDDFPVEEVSLSLCKHYLHLECYNKIQTRNRCCMCRRYEPTESDMNHLLIICEDPRNSCEIEIREQLNPVGQQLLKDFEDGIISAQNLEDRANEILEDQMRVDCD